MRQENKEISFTGLGFTHEIQLAKTNKYIYKSNEQKLYYLDKEQVGIIQIAKANLVNDPQNTITHRRSVAKVGHKYLISTQTLISIVRNLILQN